MITNACMICTMDDEISHLVKNKAAVDVTSSGAAPALRPRTPGVVLGPFYPVPPIEGASADLCRNALTNGGVQARPLELCGRVLNTAGMAVVGAQVEIWHADGSGCYRHASAPGAGQVDANFLGFGAQHTDANGRFLFRTLVPGPYDQDGSLRAPHIHFQVTGRFDRLITQMFFPDEPLNGSDRWYRFTVKPERLVASVVNDTHATMSLSWDIVLASG